ncbi:MAG: methyltransferase domain-containing protein [Propionibacteriaceae bacterium]|nr:methyltransferase domain-containing protein [Propionibacteriaceae bacterium]
MSDRHGEVRHSPAVWAAYRAYTVESAAGFLLPHLKPGDSLIDLGCGEGWITRGLAQAVAPGRVVGVDLRPPLIDYARTVQPLPDNLTFMVGDLHRLDLPPASFDVAFFHQVLQRVPDPVAALQAAARLVKPGGIVASQDADYGCVGWHPATTAWPSWQRIFLALGEARGVDLRVARRLIEIAQLAGLTDIRHQASVATFPGVTGIQLYTEAWADRLTSPSFVRQAVQAKVATKAELHSLAEELKVWSRHPAAFFGLPEGELIARVPA